MKLKDSNSAIFRLDPDTGYMTTTAKLSRIGAMEYLGSELGRNPKQVYDVVVEESELFQDSVIKSFENRPVSIEHPDDKDGNEVNADNWRKLAVGHIYNVRRDGDFLVGDVVVNDAAAIKTIQSGKVEVSCGYDADLVDSEDGSIKKVNIRGNHLAIVDEGRCGSECRLQDGKPKMSESKSILRKLFGLNKPKTKIKVGDSKVKFADRKKKLNDAKADFDAKLKDVEEIVVSADATVEEKAAAVQELLTEADNLKTEADAIQEEASQAVDQAAELAAEIEKEAPTDATVTDEDVVAVAGEAGDEIARLEARVAELEAENQQLKDELAAEKEKNAATSTMADAKKHFPKVVLKDSMSSKDIKRAVVVSTGAFTDAEAKKLADCALDSAYATAKVANAKTNNIGRKILGDSVKTKTQNRASQLGGKK